MNNWLNIFFVGGATIVGGLINFFYHPLMLKYLTIEEYGIFATLVSLFNILGVLTVGISFFLNREISKNINNLDYVKSIFVNGLKIFGLVGIVAYIVFIFLIPFLEESLKIYDIKLFFIIGFTLILSFLLVNIDATLKGLKKFKLIGFLGILNPVIKLGLGFIFVYLGYKVTGALSAFVLSSVFGFFLSLYIVSKYLKNSKVVFDIKFLLKDFWVQKKDIFSYVLLLVFTAFFMNIDVVLARNIFDETTAGYYAGISMIGKFVVFALASIETVYYPQIMEISKDLINGKTDKKYLITNPIKMYFILGIIGIIANFFVGKIILGILKPGLVEYFDYYLLLLIYFWGFALFSFLSKILIGLNKYIVNWIILFFLVFLFVGVKIFGNISLNVYITLYILIIFILDFILIWFVWKDFIKDMNK